MKTTATIPFRRAVPTSAMRRRGAETHLRVEQLGNGDVGDHNRRLWDAQQAAYDAMAREIAAEFCGADAPPQPESRQSCAAIIRVALHADPSRGWTCAEMRELCSATANAVNSALTRLRLAGHVRQVRRGVWAAASGEPGRPVNAPVRHRAKAGTVEAIVRAYVADRPGELLRTGEVATALGIELSGASHWLHRLCEPAGYGIWKSPPKI